MDFTVANDNFIISCVHAGRQNRSMIENSINPVDEEDLRDLEHLFDDGKLIPKSKIEYA